MNRLHIYMKNGTRSFLNMHKKCTSFVRPNKGFRIESKAYYRHTHTHTQNESHGVKHTREMKEMVCCQMHWERRKHVKDFWMRNMHVCVCLCHIIIFHGIFMLLLLSVFFVVFCSVGCCRCNRYCYQIWDLRPYIFVCMCAFLWYVCSISFYREYAKAILSSLSRCEQCDLWFSFSE